MMYMIIHHGCFILPGYQIKNWCTGQPYQEQDGEEAIKDVVLVGEIPSTAKGKDLHTHFKKVEDDEAQVGDLTGG